MLYDYFASKHVEKCDIFHGWSGHSLLSSRKAKEIGAKTIIEVGSAHPLIVNKLLREEFRRYGVKTEPIPNFDRCCREMEECDYVAVPSNFVKESFLEQGFAEDKLIRLHYGVDFNKFKPTEKKDNIFRAIFVGSVILRKGVQYLLEAWNCLGLKNAELLICGLIHEDTEKIVKEYKQNKSIKFLGYASRVPYDDANVSILPSIEDGVGHVVGEAMACGLPVVVSEHTGAKDLVESGENGFVVPIRDVKSLKEKILYFYDNPEITRRMGKNARKTVEEYTWTRYGNEVVKAYEKILTK